jgi:hypothetical protein
MKINLNRLLISASFILDFIEMDILKNTTNHGKRVAYVSLKLGGKYNLISSWKLQWKWIF